MVVVVALVKAPVALPLLPLALQEACAVNVAYRGETKKGGDQEGTKQGGDQEGTKQGPRRDQAGGHTCCMFV